MDLKEQMNSNQMLFAYKIKTWQLFIVAALLCSVHDGLLQG